MFTLSFKQLRFATRGLIYIGLHLLQPSCSIINHAFGAKSNRFERADVIFVNNDLNVISSKMFSLFPFSLPQTIRQLFIQLNVAKHNCFERAGFQPGIHAKINVEFQGPFPFGRLTDYPNRQQCSKKIQPLKFNFFLSVYPRLHVT